MFDHPGDAVLAGPPGALRQVLDDARHRTAAERIAGEMEALPPVAAAAEVLQALAAA